MASKLPENQAAWATGTNQPLTVKSAPYTRPLSTEIVIKNHAVAINPVDWIVLGMPSTLMFSWIKYPFIFGYDCSGVVVEVGSSVTRFKIGDRVVGNSCGSNEKINKASHNAFQLYTVLLEHMTSEIPESLTFEKASVLPLGLSTAAVGLFQKDQLALEYPTSPRCKKGNGKTLLIWGGSTSVGVNAIQLAVAAGYEVITTCSPKNFPLVTSLGASAAFDYNSPAIVPDLIHALKSKTLTGALTIGAGASDACMDILPDCKGNKFISMATYPTPPTPPPHFPTLLLILTFLRFSLSNWYKSTTRGVKTAFISGGSLVDNEVGKMIYQDFLPRALESGEFKASPEPIVVGKGLEEIQGALETQKRGVSAGKVVVSL